MSPRNPSPIAAMVNVVEKYSQSETSTNPVKYNMSTALEPKRSARIPAGNPPKPKNMIWIVTNHPKLMIDTENSFSNIIRITGRIMVIACTRKCPTLVIIIFFCNWLI